MPSKAHLQSPFGFFEIIASEKGISNIQRIADLGVTTCPKVELLQTASEQLQEYFEGKRQQFDLSLDWSGQSEFYQQVWTALLKVPYGKTSSYSAIANAIDQPKAVRAIGLANKYNPIAIVVPCHRIIAKNGHLQGYFYGLDIKRQLLALENPMSFAPQTSLF